jgi:hypothetical protein
MDLVNRCFLFVPRTFHQVPVRWIEFQAVPGPEARAWRAKIMRHTSFLGPGGPPQLRIVDCGMRIEKETPTPEIRNSKSAIQSADLFSRPAPGGTSGPQACPYPGKGNQKAKGDKTEPGIVFAR